MNIEKLKQAIEAALRDDLKKYADGYLAEALCHKETDGRIAYEIPAGDTHNNIPAWFDFEHF